MSLITAKRKIKSKIFFVIGVISLVLSAICAVITSCLNATQLSGNAVAVMRDFGNYAGVRSHQFREDMQMVFAYAFLSLLVLGLVMIVIGIVKKLKSTSK